MINIQTIQNVSDCVPLYLPHSLYLKPLAKLNILVALPINKTGKSISNLDIMEKLSAALKPDKFFVLKVSKSTVEFIRFEAELEDRSRLRNAISRLDGITLKISGFSETFKVRASEPKDEFPTRHDWDSFFRDASHMDEMKAGERPDTIHLTHLPIRWFCPRHAENDDNVKPSESIFKRIFEKFGSVRCVDIPICDPYRNKMNSDINGMKTFSFEQDVLFEAYVQFDEYVGFVRAMDEFRGMKLVRKFVDKTQAINITVTFDKSKHLSDAQIQRRERVRKRLISKVKAEEEEKERQKQQELEKLEQERKKEEQQKLAELERQREREERRKEKHLKKIQERGQVEISQKIRIEERKLMIAQRKLESIRILEQLFDRIRLKHIQKQNKHRSHTNDTETSKDDLRDRLVEKYKIATEKLLHEQKKKVEEIKSKTPLMGLLKSKKSKASDSSDDEATNAKSRHLTQLKTEPNGLTATPAEGLNPLNPFKAVAALAAAGGAAPTAPPGYSTEAASEWMKSLSMFPYVPSVFSGMPPLYRPSTFPVSMNYRGYAPRPRGRGRGRGRGRAGYNSTYYNNHKYNYDDDQYEEDDYHKSYSRSRNRSHSRSRSYTRSRSRKRHYSKRSRSRARSHSRSRSRSRQRRTRTRSRSRSHTHSRSWTRSRTHSRSKSKSKSKTRRYSRTRAESTKSRKSRTRSKTPPRTNKKLVSTRRSCSSSDWSRSRSHSRSRTRSKRSWSRRGERSTKRTVVLETDKLVRSAEEIKRTIEKDMKDRMREEEREIKDNFRHRKHQSNANVATAVVSSSGNDLQVGAADNGSTASASASAANSPTNSRYNELEKSRRISEDKRSHRSGTSRRKSSDGEADAF